MSVDDVGGPEKKAFRGHALRSATRHGFKGRGRPDADWPDDLDEMAATHGAVAPDGPARDPGQPRESSPELIRACAELGDRCVRGCRALAGPLGLCRTCAGLPVIRRRFA